jgi:hypothetical protein
MVAKGVYGWYIKNTTTKQFVRVLNADLKQVGLVDRIQDATRFDSRPHAVASLNALGLFSPDNKYLVIDQTIPALPIPDKDPIEQSPPLKEVLASIKAQSAANEAERAKRRQQFGGPSRLIPAPPGGNPPAGGFGAGAYGKAAPGTPASNPLFQPPPAAPTPSPSTPAGEK